MNFKASRLPRFCRAWIGISCFKSAAAFQVGLFVIRCATSPNIATEDMNSTRL